MNGNPIHEPSNGSPIHQQSVRHSVTFSKRRFDVKTLPADMQRVYWALEEKFGEEYALLFVFTMRTAIELHRAWHMTLLTSKILQQIKDKFGLRMTWNLGAIRLKFRVEDGGFELHRKVPYDYDSEYQDLYARIAVALVEGHIGVHDALIFQTETKQGKHTACSGLFLRDFPGRLILYPFQASTCAVIFFGGDWLDAGIAAVCGLAAGIVEYAMSYIGGEAKVLIDLLVGTVTGVIGGVFYRFHGERNCLSSIFLGTLYWFFYGTAFVIGLLEIIAGELETGVTRFIAVSVKTFVLCLGASFGMLMALPNPAEIWVEQENNCNTINLDQQWWRIPLYLACSASALGQYRVPLVQYWRGLAVQLVAYEVQYQVLQFFVERSKSEQDNLDTAAANVLGAACAVVAACIVTYIVNQVQSRYYGRLLQRNQGAISKFDGCFYRFMACGKRVFAALGLYRKDELAKLELEKKLKKVTDELNNPNHPRAEIVLKLEEENLLVDTIVCAESPNIWAILMPAVYQLVPGSMIAKLWFNSIFPPPLKESEATIPGTSLTYTVFALDRTQDNIFSNLMVISTSLALGLIIGFAFVQTSERILSPLACWETDKEKKKSERDRHAGMYTMAKDAYDDPASDNEN